MARRNGRVGLRAAGVERKDRIGGRVSVCVPVVGAPGLFGRPGAGAGEEQMRLVAAFGGEKWGVVGGGGGRDCVVGDLGVGGRRVGVVRAGAEVDADRAAAGNAAARQ